MLGKTTRTQATRKANVIYATVQFPDNFFQMKANNNSYNLSSNLRPQMVMVIAKSQSPKCGADNDPVDYYYYHCGLLLSSLCTIG